MIAACPLVLGMPNAVISSRPSNPNFELYWRLSKEYCAWIYYTPDDRYEMSMLTTSFAQDNPRKRKCRVPPNVHDARYSDESIGHVFVIHNHPVGNELSRDDIQFIVDMGSIHGFTVKTREREVPIGIVAFFSGTDLPTCNGFFLYTPATSEILKWTVSQKSEWKKELYDMVKWLNSSEFEIEYK